eukprot:8679695-Lingulodinium_polyedra.AAC.1
MDTTKPFCAQRPTQVLRVYHVFLRRPGSRPRPANTTTRWGGFAPPRSVRPSPGAVPQQQVGRVGARPISTGR